MQYRPAIPADADRIAALHARSWQETYRGMMPDAFLANDVEAERLAYWRDEFAKSPPNRHIIVAEADGQLAGFACIIAGHDPVYGALLDNLHVSTTYKGRGIGRNLMKLAAEWVREHQPDSSFYLWVYEKNHAARTFYDGLGARNQEAVPGDYTIKLRYVWPDLQTLITVSEPLVR